MDINNILWWNYNSIINLIYYKFIPFSLACIILCLKFSCFIIAPFKPISPATTTSDLTFLFKNNEIKPTTTLTPKQF